MITQGSNQMCMKIHIFIYGGKTSLVMSSQGRDFDCIFFSRMNFIINLFNLYGRDDFGEGGNFDLNPIIIFIFLCIYIVVKQIEILIEINRVKVLITYSFYKKKMWNNVK